MPVIYYSRSSESFAPVINFSALSCRFQLKHGKEFFTDIKYVKKLKKLYAVNVINCWDYRYFSSNENKDNSKHNIYTLYFMRYKWDVPDN